MSGRAGDLFKAPMPPQQEVCGGGRRDPSRPTDLNFAGLSQSQDSAFPSSPRSALGSPHRSPYAQMPGTPRPDYNQQTTDPFPQQSPPYVGPQTPGTPRPHSETPYMVTPPALRLEPYSQQPPVVCTQKPLVEGFPPQHAGAGSSPSASEPLTSAQNQVPEKSPALDPAGPASLHLLCLSIAAFSRTTASPGLVSKKPHQPDPEACWVV